MYTPNKHCVHEIYTPLNILNLVRLKVMYPPINVNFCFTLRHRHKITLNQFNVGT